MNKLLLISATLLLLGAGCAQGTKTISSSDTPRNTANKQDVGCIFVKPNGDPVISASEVKTIFKKDYGAVEVANGQTTVSGECQLTFISIPPENRKAYDFLDVQRLSQEAYATAKKGEPDAQPNTPLTGIGDESFVEGSWRGFGYRIYVKKANMYFRVTTSDNDRSLNQQASRIVAERVPTKTPPPQDFSRLEAPCKEELKSASLYGFVFTSTNPNSVLIPTNFPAPHTRTKLCGWYETFYGLTARVESYYQAEGVQASEISQYYQTELKARGFEVTAHEYTYNKKTVQEAYLEFEKKSPEQIKGKININNESYGENAPPLILIKITIESAER